MMIKSSTSSKSTNCLVWLILDCGAIQKAMNKLESSKEFKVWSICKGSQIITGMKSLVVQVPWSTGNFQCKMLNWFEQKLILPQMRAPDSSKNWENMGLIQGKCGTGITMWGIRSVYKSKLSPCPNRTKSDHQQAQVLVSLPWKGIHLTSSH